MTRLCGCGTSAVLFFFFFCLVAVAGENFVSVTVNSRMSIRIPYPKADGRSFALVSARPEEGALFRGKVDGAEITVSFSVFETGMPYAEFREVYPEILDEVVASRLAEYKVRPVGRSTVLDRGKIVVTANRLVPESGRQSAGSPKEREFFVGLMQMGSFVGAMIMEPPSQTGNAAMRRFAVSWMQEIAAVTIGSGEQPVTPPIESVAIIPPRIGGKELTKAGNSGDQVSFAGQMNGQSVKFTLAITDEMMTTFEFQMEKSNLTRRVSGRDEGGMFDVNPVTLLNVKDILCADFTRPGGKHPGMFFGFMRLGGRMCIAVVDSDPGLVVELRQALPDWCRRLTAANPVGSTPTTR